MPLRQRNDSRHLRPGEGTDLHDYPARTPWNEPNPRTPLFGGLVVLVGGSFLSAATDGPNGWPVAARVAIALVVPLGAATLWFWAFTLRHPGYHFACRWCRLHRRVRDIDG